MKFYQTKWFWAVVILVIIIGYGVVSYNSFISQNETVDKQWAQVETQYQRRFDLIPNLVASVKGIMNQEQAVFLAIADARTKYSGAVTVNDKAAAATQVESALGRLLVIMENYPALQSAQNVQILMAQLEGTENRISVERQRFNDEVRSFNVSVQTLPSSLVAKMFGFSTRNYFEAATGSDVVPAVNL